MATPVYGVSKVPETGLPDITGLLNQFLGQYGRGTEESERLFGEGMAGMQRAVDLFAPGGAFEQSAMEKYEIGKQRAMSGAMQNLLSSGLSKGSTPAALERGFEREVGAPYRTGVAAEASGRLSSALQNMANYALQQRGLYPAAGTLSYLATGGFGALAGQQAKAAEAGLQQQALNQMARQEPSKLGTLGGSSTGGLSNISSPFSGSMQTGDSSFGSMGSSATSPVSGPGFGQASEIMAGTDPRWQADYWGGSLSPTGAVAPVVGESATTGPGWDRYLKHFREKFGRAPNTTYAEWAANPDFADWRA